MSDEENKLTYFNDAGEEIFTSTYHLNRGTCCKSNCLHCPFGHTLKNFNIEILPLKEKFIRYANQIIADSKPVEISSFALSILAEGFGKKDKIIKYYITDENFKNYAFGQFKENICAVIEFSTKLSESTSGRGIKELFLKKEFQNQGLFIKHIEK